MNNLQYYKQLFSKKNLYFIASFAVLVTAIIMLLVLLRGQASSNLQAKIFSETSKEVSVEVIEKQRAVADSKVELEFLPDTNMVIDPEEDISAVTRYLDEIFAQFPGEFVNTSLTFSELRESEGLAYTEANLNITSSRENFDNFLKFVENTGFSPDGQSRLMEIRSININLDTTENDETLSYRVVMRIYFQSQTEEEVQATPSEQTNNPFADIIF